MKVNKAVIVAVTARANHYPPDNMPEIAFAGRSNVGKSSLLNLLTGRKKLAKISGTPGKTRTINFYEINDRFRIVDLPGYGYAKVSKSESEKWGAMMDEYLQTREGLIVVAQLIDIRHEPTAQDIQMYEYLQYYGLSGLIVATKADKISRNQLQKQMAMIRRKLNADKDDVILPVSALNRTGHEELLDELDECVKYYEEVKSEQNR
ncbi:MAG: YihA family ribosome biogenesis GTP-binding protein [Firmicutes bacterium]|nr:YihA family ribosome biogenesis GTP-binding protein [Bacillota bacterium]